MNKTPLISPEMVTVDKQSRFNPLPGLTPEGLNRQLDSFRAGYLRPLALTMDVIEERDDLLSSVVPKAKAAPTVHGWEINTQATFSKGEEAKAAAQKETLEYFYNNLRCTSAIDQDLLGGATMLLEQMMDAKGKRYSVHNIVWQPRDRGRYTATFWHTPLWFFENKTGKMRFIQEVNGMDGVEMKHGAWLVTVGRGLMIPCSVGWMFKHLPMRDWLIYCRRHGLPGFEGVTDDLPGTPEYEKLIRAVRAAASGEFAWVRSNSQQINKMDFGAEGELPFPELVDRMDRAMSAIWRGGDLSTMSKGDQAIGAEGQEGEGELIEVKDADWLSEQCNFRIDRLVIDYVYGEDEPLLAYFTVKKAQKQDISMDLRVDEFAIRNGHPVSRKQFAERYNRPEPPPEDELLGAPEEEEEGQAKIAKAINEASLATFNQAMQRDALPAAKKIVALLGLEGNAFRTQAKTLRDSLPGLLANAGVSSAEEIEEILAGAFLAGVLGTEVPAINSYDPSQARDWRGRWAQFLAPNAGGGGGLSPKGQARVYTNQEMVASIDAALADATAGVQSVHSLGRVPDALAARVARETGRDFADKELRIDSDFVTHARAYHPNLTDDDFRQIPAMLDSADRLAASTTNRQLPAVEFHKRIDSRDWLLIGAQLNKKGQVQLITLKKTRETV